MVSTDFKKKNFYFDDDDLVFFNHGSDGICPMPVLEEKFNILRKFEENPVMGFAETMFDGCLENTVALANRIGTSSENLSIIENVTTGFCSILQSIEFKIQEEILITNFTYQGVKMAVEEICSKKGCIINTLHLDSTFKSNEDIINIYEKAVKDNSKIKYAIIDHIFSGLPVVQPVKEITKVLRRLGVFVIIDGAHAPGQLKNLNIRDIDADIYLGSLHKWYFLPRGCSFLAVREGLKLQIKPHIVSFLHDRELYLRFAYVGTKDISNMLCIKPALEFIDNLGGFEGIHSLITEIMERGISYLESTWNVITLTFPEMAPFTRLVPLPAGFAKYSDSLIEINEKPFRREYYMYTFRKLKFAVKLLSIKNQLCFRLCCHIYNTQDDFVKFSERVLHWLDLLEGGETLS